MSSSSSSSSDNKSSSPFTKIYGLPPGPFSVGVTTTQFTDSSRLDPGDSSQNRGLQTEIWYPATETSSEGAQHRRNKFSDFLGIAGIANKEERKAALETANTAIGGYRDGLTIHELDTSVWTNMAYRDATPASSSPLFPLVVFSHGSGAYRASYIYWCEYLASHGYVVAACDHPGSARFTIVNGKVIVPDDDGTRRSERSSMEHERPLDIGTIIDGMQGLAQTDSRFQGRVDCHNVGVTGMSFGGYTTAAFLELQDERVKAAILQCPSIAKSKLECNRQNKTTPVMVMLATEDTVIGEEGNQAGRDYVDNHSQHGDCYLLEIVRGGHVSFTSGDIYNPNYGNGIGGPCPSLTKQPEGETYMPLDIMEQHKMINSYGLAFLNAYLKQNPEDMAYLKANHFAETGELIYRAGRKWK